METQKPPFMKYVSMLYRCTQAYADEKLEKFQLSGGTYPFLIFLSKKDGVSQNHLSAELNVDKAMSARAIKRLIELGYVRKNVDEKDSRAYRIYLTDRGREIAPEVVRIMDEWILSISQGSTEAEYETTMKFLYKALSNAKGYKKI